MNIQIASHSLQLAGTELTFSSCPNEDALKARISDVFGLQREDFYLTQNGRLVTRESSVDLSVPVRITPRVLGGKGGFGSMLRAIGAQIEKTTNRDACRDLSGRRLRDINEEQRLKRWFAKQAEREREREENRQKKLEKLRRIQDGPPLPLIDDVNYNQQRADMSDSVFEAVDKGFEASKQKKSPEASTTEESNPTATNSSSDESQPQPSASSSATVTSSKPVGPPKKKLKKLMMDEDFDTDSSSEDSESETAVAKN
ncbi:unnamed protein product [Allacma fusca]|uniref:SDE2-like domain-containing protein n=1 Tax=Allacma fusca TaxID=39272 RepID=A0A8J2PTA5_9HEXA|nr:unnamed protein product [Allacma fusca]